MGAGIDLTFDGHLALITLDRPDRMNALDRELWGKLGERLAEAAARAPRALVVTGGAGQFSAGMDLSPDNPYMESLGSALARPEATRILDELRATLERLWSFPAPTLAAVEGACLGGGLELAIGCDLRVAGAGARVGLPETRFGTVPDLGGTVRLARLVGPGRAALLVLTAGTFDARECERLGIFERVVETGAACDEAFRLARKIASNAPEAIRRALELLRRAPDLPIDGALALERSAGIAALCSGEVAEGLHALAERRPPRWTDS